MIKQGLVCTVCYWRDELMLMFFFSWCSHLFLPGTYWFVFVVKLQSDTFYHCYFLLMPIYIFLPYLRVWINFFQFVVKCFCCLELTYNTCKADCALHYQWRIFWWGLVHAMYNSLFHFVNTPFIGTETEMLSIESKRNTQLTCNRFCWDSLKKKKSILFHIWLLFDVSTETYFLQCCIVPLVHPLLLLSAWFSYPMTLDADSVFFF